MTIAETFKAALAADEAYSAALKAAGVDRWTRFIADNPDHPVRVAYRNKVAADQAHHAAWVASRPTLAEIRRPAGK